MNPSRTFILASAAAAALFCSSSLRAADKINYQDHVLPIFRNNCLNCHNPDKKKAGLDLSTYQTALQGSDNGAVINSGDPDGSTLYKVVTHAEEPTMPPKRDKLPDKELATIKAWIADGALETANGKPAVSTKPKINLTVASTGMKKPDGPLPMPKDLLPEPVVRGERPWAVGCMANSPWAPVVAIGGQHQILIYNTDTLDLLGIVPFPEGEPSVVQFSRNGRVLLIGGGVAAKSGKVALWDVTTGQKLTDVGEEFDSVLGTDISPDQSAVALGGPTKVFKIYSTRDGTLLHSTKKHTDWVTAVAYSPDGVLLCSADRAGGMWVWESKSGNEFYNLAGHKAGVTSVAFRDDSNFLASASEDGTVKLWDMQSGKEVKSWNAHSGGVLSVAFTHDGNLVTCGRDRSVRTWKPDGSQIRAFESFSDIALHATFDYAGKRVIAGDWTGDLRVWDAADGKLVGHLSSNPAPLADRLVAAEKHVPELEAALTKARADAAAADAQAADAVKGLKSLEAETAAAKAASANAPAKVKAADEAIQAAKTAVKEAETSVTEKQSKVNHHVELRNQVRKSLEAAKAAKAADDKISVLTKHATEEDAELLGANQALDAARKLLAEKNAGLEKARVARKDAEAFIPKGKAAAAAMEKSLAARPAQVKAAQAHAAEMKAVADAASAQLVNGKQEIIRLKVGQFFLNVYSAKQELATQQSQLDQATASVKAAESEAADDTAAIAAAKKALADAPNHLKELAAAAAKAKDAVAPAAAAAQAAQADLAQKQMLLDQANQLATKLWAETHKTPEDKQLADASAKARAIMEPLTAKVEAATKDAEAKAEAAKTAAGAVTSADAALTKHKADLDSYPKKIAALEKAIVAAQADLPKRKTAEAAASKAVAAAKAKLDQVTAEFNKKSQEAGLNAQASARGKS